MVDLLIEERKKTFKTSISDFKYQYFVLDNQIPVIHEREKYSMILRKEKKNSIITQKRLKSQNEVEENQEEINEINSILKNYDSQLVDPLISIVFS